MAFNVNEFRSQLKFDGARPNLFLVRFVNTGDVRFDGRTEFFVNATEIPPAQIGMIEIPYFGRRIKIPGDRTFPQWSVNIINDEDFAIRTALENWSNSMNDLAANVRLRRRYLSDAEVTQFSKTGQPLRTYKFVNIFPTDISAIQLGWGQTDSIEEFSASFQYDYWQVSDARVPTGSGEPPVPSVFSS